MWKCEVCKTEVEIDRKVHANDSPPVSEETKESECIHRWKKIIGRTGWNRGSNWTGSKGNWLILLAIGLLSSGGLMGCTTFRRPKDRGIEITNELDCPATQVIQYYHPISNMIMAIKTATRSCNRDNMCLKSINELQPNMFHAICKKVIHDT